MIKENTDLKALHLNKHAPLENIEKRLAFLKLQGIEKLDIIALVEQPNKIQQQAVETFVQVEITAQVEAHHQLNVQLELIEILKEVQYCLIAIHDQMDTFVKLQDLQRQVQDHVQQDIIVHKDRQPQIQQLTYAQRDLIVLQDL